MLWEKASASERATLEELLRQCSALRVIPDALPSVYNEVALMGSLQKIFLISDVEPESLSPSGDNKTSSDGVGTIGVSFRVEDTADKSLGLLTNMEKSIRAFNTQKITIEWKGGDKISLRGTANAFYLSPQTIETKKITIKPGSAKSGITTGTTK
jgi:hypothetical protein